ncbi:hypothetical protein B9Z19DRAFT_1087576 [Tuber borchii]|uniref:Uncharacterized protein n=1 Tax=Tuber borchii TaxID=42251 RepID=A0A2T6ZMU1_TUBBO|nr:hypothetical protein B9Z19DRAFT_1087576 [Tuber borchii]
MIENNLKDERIKTLKKEIHDLRNKKKTNRKVIPDQGASFLSQTNIRSFFAYCQAEKQRKHQAKIDRLQTKITATETKLNSLSFEKTLSDAKTKLQGIDTVEDARTDASDSDPADIERPVFPDLGES